MGIENVENTFGELQSEEVEYNNEKSSEITTDELEIAFDETERNESVDEFIEADNTKDFSSEKDKDFISSSEISKAFDDEKNEYNRVSSKEEKTEYYLDKTESLNNYFEKNDSRYDRPTGYRAGIRDQVWENAKDEYGRVRDPVSGKYMSKDKPWHMGHKPGYEFSKHQDSAERRGISREEFLDEHNNPEHYRPELPKSNMSHKGESQTENYYD